MRWLESWKGWRRYRRLDSSWKKIVFYSESGQDWHFFEPLISELLKRHDEQVTYVSSDACDAGLKLKHPRYVSLCIPGGLFLIIHFQVLKAHLLVLTMMDLGNLQLKKSIYPVHYVYLFHSMGSTHMVDHANSYDAYDTLFCVGPHHVAELRRREALSGLPPRHLFHYGHPRLESLLKESQARTNVRQQAGRPVVLIAPTWGENAILARHGETLLETLLEADFHVIVRPHHQTIRLTPNVVQRLLDRFDDHPRLEIVTEMAESASLFRSDVLISDWSAMAIEYFLGLEKPVLFIDVPRRIRNPDWETWEIEPIEAAIRQQAGTVLHPGAIKEVAHCIRSLMSRRPEFQTRARDLRAAAVFNPGSSAALGAAELVRLASQPANHAPAGQAHG